MSSFNADNNNNNIEQNIIRKRKLDPILNQIDSVLEAAVE